MSTIELVVLLLFSVTFLVALAHRISLPGEIVLVLGGALLAFVPGLPRVELDPEVVFFMFLPPILYSAALFTSWREFKQNARPISFLAVGLVLFTTVGIAVTSKFLIPDFTWPLAFLLGAILSPPDAIAATAITKQISVPRRLVAIIEGESLVNDATALVLYRVALGAIVTGAFSWFGAGQQLLVVAVGGTVLGLIVAAAILELRKRVSVPLLENLLSVLTPFAAYIIAEHLHLSGVLAVVAAGLYVAKRVPTNVSAQNRLRAYMLWDFIVFVLNAMVFILIGLELHFIVGRLHNYSTQDLAWYALALCIVTVATRFLAVFSASYLPRSFGKKKQGGNSYEHPAPSWQVLTVLSWSGMRGIVSLAAASAIPHHLPDGSPFPNRDLIILLTYAVTLFTLLLPGLTLTKLISYLGVRGDSSERKEELHARIAGAQNALMELERLEREGKLATSNANHLRTEYDLRLQVLSAALGGDGCLPEYTEEEELRLARLSLLNTERQQMLELRRLNVVDDQVMLRLQAELDMEEVRLQGQKAQREEFQGC